jgi:hypothetical protein
VVVVWVYADKECVLRTMSRSEERILEIKELKKKEPRD